MAVTVRVEHFDGPLDLLLQLVEREELDISRISLATVAEQFVAHVHEHPEIPPQDLVDYLVIAAKLVYMKAKLLIPSLVDEELEEGPDLETQLREYRRFLEASRQINILWETPQRMTARPIPMMMKREGFILPKGVSIESLFDAIRRVIVRLEPVHQLPKARMKRVVTIQEKIRDLLSRIAKSAKMTFREFCEGSGSRQEAVVSFLAILELTKQRHILVAQDQTFSDIRLKLHPDAPSVAPVPDTYL